MKAAFAASALAMASCAEAFVAPSAARAALSPSTALDTSRAATTVRSTPSMEFAGGLRGADGPEPNSKNFDPFGFSEAKPENLLFYREAEVKVRSTAASIVYHMLIPVADSNVGVKCFASSVKL